MLCEQLAHLMVSRFMHLHREQTYVRMNVRIMHGLVLLRICGKEEFGANVCRFQ